MKMTGSLPPRHSGLGRNPRAVGCADFAATPQVAGPWIPAFAGMTGWSLAIFIIIAYAPVATYEDENDMASSPSLPRKRESTHLPWILTCNRMTDEVSVGNGKGVKGASRWVGDAAPFRVRWGNLAPAIFIMMTLRAAYLYSNDGIRGPK